MRVRRQGAKVTWLRDDGKTGSATIVAQDKTRNDMSVAMVAGQPSLRLGGPPPLPADTADRAPHPTSQARPSMPKATPSAAPVAPQQKAPAPSHTATTTTAPATASGRVMVRQRAVPPAISVAPPAQATATAGRAPAPAVTLPAPSYRVVHVRTDDVLNIRSAPSAEAEIIGAIPYYSGGVRRIGPCHGEWCAIAFNTTTGWADHIFSVRSQARALVAGRTMARRRAAVPSPTLNLTEDMSYRRCHFVSSPVRVPGDWSCAKRC